MGESREPQPTADRNLLFGILALQMDFISDRDLIAAMQAWVFDKTKTLGQVLTEQGKLSTDRLELLDALVNEHLKAHQNDPERSLAALSAVSAVREQLCDIRDDDLQASLARVGASRAGDPESTGSFHPEPEDSSSAGLRYRILRLHARGGLGEVYVAEDQELHREVALKEIQERHAHDPVSRGRFLLEAEITGSLEHPGIVPVYGLGQYADGRPFYAMRFIKGDNLKQAIRRFHEAEVPGRDPGERSLALRQLLRRFVDVCNAVAYAHSRGVLHRDLKPGNIMLGKYGETLLVDWGLAKPVGRPEFAKAADEQTLRPSSGTDLAMTQMGSAIGTPGYMSPEQAAGRLDLLGPASDIYNLGATLYALLTGKAPFREDAAGEVLQKIQRGEVVWPSELKPETPKPLDAICRKAMAVRQEDRYATALALAADIEHWLADEPVSAWPEPASVRAGRWIKRHRTLVSSAAATLLVTILGLIVGLVLLAAAKEQERIARMDAQDKEREAQDQRQVADQKAEEARLQKLEAEKQRDSARLNLYVMQMNLAQRALEDGNGKRAVELLERQVPKQPDDKDLRGFEWYYLWRLCHSERFILAGHKDDVVAYEFTPDGLRLGSASKDGTVKFWDTATGQELFSFPARIRSMVFSPDGKRLATAGGDWSQQDKTGELKIRDAATGQELFSFPARIRSMVFSPDGKRLATVEGDWSKQDKTGELRIRDAATGRLLLSPKLFADGVSRVNFSRNSERIVVDNLLKPWEEVRERDWEVKVLDTATGHDLLSLKFESRFLTEDLGPVLSADGKRLALAFVEHTGEDGKRLARFEKGVISRGFAKVWDVDTGRECARLEGARKPMAFSPDNKRLATAAFLYTVSMWDLDTNKPLFSLRIAEGTSFRLSPDGQRLALRSDDKTVKLFDSSSGREVLSLPGHAGLLSALKFSPDGRSLATSDHSATHVWDVSNAREVLSGPLVWGKVIFTEDARCLVCQSAGKYVKIWDLTLGQQPFSPRYLRFAGSLAYSPDGRRLATSAGDEIRVLDSATGGELVFIKLDSDSPNSSYSVHGVAYNPDGKKLAARVYRSERKGRFPSALVADSIRVWDAKTGQELFVHKHSVGTASSNYPAFSADGRYLAWGYSDGTVKICEAEGSKEPRSFQVHAGPVLSVAFSPDGYRIASAATRPDFFGPAETKIWERETGRILFAIYGHSAVFSPDGRRLATVPGTVNQLNPGEVKLWDAATGRELMSLKGHGGGISKIAFSRDSRRLASASGDATVKIWEMESGQEVLSLKITRQVYAMLGGSIDSIAFGPDGKNLAVGAVRGRIWESEMASPDALLRRHADILVESLFGSLATKSDVLEHLQRDRKLSERLRREALAKAEDYSENPARLNGLSWATVFPGRADKEAYRLALRRAREACRLDPENGYYLNTLGVAQYRMEQYREALETLTQSNNINSALPKGPHPTDLGFLAMAHYRLGQEKKAQAYLELLREALKTQEWSNDSEAQSVLREADELVKPTAAETKR